MIAPVVKAQSQEAKRDAARHFDSCCIDLDGVILKGALSDEWFAFRANQWRRMLAGWLLRILGIQKSGYGGTGKTGDAWLTWKIPIDAKVMDFLLERGKKKLPTCVLVRPGEVARVKQWLRAKGVEAEVVERTTRLETPYHYIGENPAAGARAETWTRPRRESGGDVREGFFRAIRVHQWVKNTLVFLPILTSQTYGDLAVWTAAAWLFLAWSLVASAVYLINDFFDLPADRRHPGCSQRPMAAGGYPIKAGILMAGGMAATGLLVAGLVAPAGLALLAVYALLALAYTVAIKRFAFVDVAVLSALYLLRILAGGEVTGNEATPWLLAFSGWFFLGLAFLKRAGELREPRLLSLHAARTPARGYRVADLGRVERMGIAAGLFSALVLALYAKSESAALLYRQPETLWVLAGLLLIWLGRLWMLTRRGRMHHDPILFAVRDSGSWLIAGVSLAVMVSAEV